MHEKFLEEGFKSKVLLENLPQKIFLKDKNSVYIFCNQNYAQELGIKAEEIKGKTDYDFFPKEIAEKCRANDKRVIKKGNKENIEEKYIRNEKNFFVRIVRIPVRDSRKRVIAVLGICSDVDRPYLIKDGFKEGDRNFYALNKDTHLLICEFLPDSTLTYVNKAYSDSLGKSSEELIGKKFLDFIPVIERKAVKENYMSLTPDISSCFHEHRVKTETEVRWQEWTNRAFFKKNGKVSYFQATGRDITERKRIENELREEQRRLEYVLESTGTGIDIIDANFNLQYVNKSWQKIYGDFSGRKCYEYYMSRNNPCPKCGISKALETKKIITTEEQLPKENNKTIEVRTIPFQDTTGRWLVAEVNIDITKRKQMEKRMRVAHEKLKNIQKQLIQAEKLAALGKLSGIVAHDLRNPLAVIRNSIYLLEKRLKGSRDFRVQRYLKLLDEEIEVVDSIIEEILSFARMKQVKLSSFNIDKIISRVLASLSIPDSIKVKKIFDKNITQIKGDKGQLQRFFTNLIRNAIEAMESGGVLTVRTKQQGKSILVEVSDTGIGFSQKDAGKVFEPMYSTKIQGTGLGLSACKNIAEAHRGKIFLKSKKNKGTTFSAIFPLSPKIISIKTSNKRINPNVA